MLYIKGNDIKLTRGDTLHLTIPITNGEEEYVIQVDDTLVFSVKKMLSDSDYKIQKSIVGENTFHIEPNDTAKLPFGKYYYDIELRTAAGDIYTIIDTSSFELLTEVTCCGE